MRIVTYGQSIGVTNTKCNTPSEVEGMWWGVLEKGHCLDGNIQYYGDYTNTNNNYTNIYDTYTDTFTDEDMET